MKLTGKVAIVTGGAQGIGKAIAIKLANEGASVVIGYNIQRADQVVNEIINQGGKAIAVKANVTIRAEVVALMETAMESFKAIHVLVNNAVTRRPALLLEMTEEDWDIVLNVDLKGVFNCIQTVAGYMIEQRYGKIINISSVSGMGYARVGLANYAAAKGGVMQLTKVAAREFGPYGINVNSIAPGRITTAKTATRRSGEELEKYLEAGRRSCVLGRAGEPADVANLAAYLASDEANFITGQVIRVDGGRIDGI